MGRPSAITENISARRSSLLIFRSPGFCEVVGPLPVWIAQTESKRIYHGPLASHCHRGAAGKSADSPNLPCERAARQVDRSLSRPRISCLLNQSLPTSAVLLKDGSKKLLLRCSGRAYSQLLVVVREPNRVSNSSRITKGTSIHQSKPCLRLANGILHLSSHYKGQFYSPLIYLTISGYLLHRSASRNLDRSG
jgi:hypothetical protein